MSKDTIKTTVMKRDAQPRAVRDAKDAAGRLAAYLAGQGVNLSRAQALEALSCAAGATDWNTFRAELGSPRVDVAEAKVIVLQQLLHLHAGGEEACIEKVVGLMKQRSLPQQQDMWRSRAEICIHHLVAVFFKLQELPGRSFSPLEFRHAFALNGEGGFLDLLTTCEARFPEISVVQDAWAFIAAFPRAPNRGWKLGDPLSVNVQDHWGYLCMQVTKPLGELIDVEAK